MIESFIDNAKEQFSLTDDIYGNIMIAVTESVNNAIRHGNKGDSKKNVDLSLKLSDGSIIFWVKDEGDGFDRLFIQLVTVGIQIYIQLIHCKKTPIYMMGGIQSLHSLKTLSF